MAATCYMDEDDASAGQNDPHNGNTNGLFFIEFVETLIRCSWTLFPNLRSLSERFNHMMSVDVRAHAKSDSRDRLQSQLSAAIGSDAMDRHRHRLMKIFKHFSQEIGALFAPSEVMSPGSTVPDTSPYLDSPTSSSSASEGKRRQAQERKPFQGPYTVKPDDAGASILEEAGPPPPPSQTEGGGKAKSSSSSSKAGGGVGQVGGGSSGRGAGQAMVSPLGASAASEEGVVSMTFNDLLRMLNKLDLYSPQLNLTKVQSIVKQITMDKDLMPQEHPHNSKSKLIFEEFAEILARFAVACNESGTPTALRLKEPQGAWTMLEEYLDSTLYPRVKKILPGRL